MSTKVAPDHVPTPKRRLSHTPAYEHSWLGSPPYYTAMSVLFFLLFFVQPHSWRVRLWSTLRPTIQDERLFLLCAGVITHSGTFIIANLIMTLIYSVEHPFFEQFKIQQHRPWPWKTEERHKYFQLIRKSILLVIFNQFVIAPILVLISYNDQKKFGMNGDIDSVPPWYTSMIQIAIAMVIEDALFYWAHRALHHPFIYGRVHKVHHQYKTSIGLASEYAHPIEFIFSNAIPFSVGPMVCGMHYLTFLQWSILRVGETVDGHSGYEFPWSPYRLLPFSGSSTAHDFHHSHNVGNYASFFSWWDHLMGTDQAFLKFQAKVEDQLEIEAEEKAKREESAPDTSAATKETPPESPVASEDESAAAPVVDRSAPSSAVDSTHPNDGSSTETGSPISGIDESASDSSALLNDSHTSTPSIGVAVKRTRGRSNRAE